MSKLRINKRERWSSAMEILNVVMPFRLTHKDLLKMSRSLYLSDFKFRPPTDEPPRSLRSVRDIQEFLSHGVRFIIIENEQADPCSLIIEFFGEDRRGVEKFTFDMERL